MVDAYRVRHPRAKEATMKRCAQCHGKLGLGVRSRIFWNGRWWAHTRFCSAHCEGGAGLPSWSTSKTRCPTGSRCRMSHGPFQEPFTGQKPFSKRPDPQRACDGPGLATCTSAYSANDQLTNAVACAWFELHPNLRYLKSKVAEPAKFKHGDPALSLPEYRPSGARLARGQWVREWRRDV